MMERPLTIWRKKQIFQSRESCKFVLSLLSMTSISEHNNLTIDRFCWCGRCVCMKIETVSKWQPVIMVKDIFNKGWLACTFYYHKISVSLCHSWISLVFIIFLFGYIYIICIWSVTRSPKLSFFMFHKCIIWLDNDIY